jgi:hypothetical protein
MTLLRWYRQCLSANSAMVDYVVPLMIEKLDASSSDVKVARAAPLTLFIIEYHN